MDDILRMLKKIKSFTDLEPLVEEEGQPSLSFLSQDQQYLLEYSDKVKYLEFFTYVKFLEKVSVHMLLLESFLLLPLYLT